jgi:hypothetical protein
MSKPFARIESEIFFPYWDRTRSFCATLQKQNLFLLPRRQVQEVHDLCDTGA